MYQAGWLSGNALDSYAGAVRFDIYHGSGFLWFSSVRVGKCWRINGHICEFLRRREVCDLAQEGSIVIHAYTTKYSCSQVMLEISNDRPVVLHVKMSLFAAQL